MMWCLWWQPHMKKAEIFTSAFLYAKYNDCDGIFLTH